MHDTIQQTQLPESASRRWLKRLGVAGFMFFLIKGLLWLIIPGAIVLWRSMSGE